MQYLYLGLNFYLKKIKEDKLDHCYFKDNSFFRIFLTVFVALLGIGVT